MNMVIDRSESFSNVNAMDNQGLLDKVGYAFTEIFKGFLDSIQFVVILLAVLLVVYLFLYSPHQVDGKSMLPNFVNKELVLTDKLFSKTAPFKRGDVIIFKYDDTKDFIKRVIGLPGETVKLSGGKVYVNGKLLQENYLPASRVTNPTNGNFMRENEEKKVPEGQYFVLGDNREASADSRSIGFLNPEKMEVRGRVFLKFFPTDKFESIPEPKYNL